MDAQKFDFFFLKILFIYLLDKNEDLIKEEKFATILEYLPYRKADWT